MSKREYIQANKDWLEAKAKEEGVKILPRGIYYKVCTLSNKRTQEYEVFRYKQDVEYISDFDKEIKRLKGEK